MKIPLLAGAYAGFSSNTSSQECINFYYEKPAQRELHMGSLLPTPGTVQFGATLGSAVRGTVYSGHNSLLYVVSGNLVYKVNSAGTETQLTGTLDTSTGNVSIAVDPTTGYLMMVDGTSGYRLSPTDITKITDSDFPAAPTACAYIDGFFLVNVTNATQGQFMWSALNDCTSWDALNVETLLSLDTTIRQILVNGRDIWFFGGSKTEVWYLAGQTTDHPFARIQRVESGLPTGVGSICQTVATLFDNSVMWPAANSRGEVEIVWANGYVPQVMSTPEIAHKIVGGFASGGANPIANAYTCIWKGHEFYVLNLLTIAVTVVYDAQTKEWHQRSGAFSSGNPTSPPAIFFTFCPDFAHRYIVADGQLSKLWYWSDTTYTHDGVAIDRRVTGPLIALENEAQLRFSEVQVDIEEGTNDGTSNDTITLTYSKDGGHTYCTGTTLALGQSGTGQSYHTRLMKRKLGTGRLWNFRIYCNSDHKLVIKGAFGRISGEPFSGFQTKGTSA